jgi:hypothetical protein
VIKLIAKLFPLGLWFLGEAVASSSYTPGTTGFGVTVGTFGGLTGYHQFSDQNFIQISVGHNLVLAGDYGIRLANITPKHPELMPFVGAGAFVFSNRYWSTYSDRGKHLSGLGVRIPLGIMYQIPEAPVHLHAEIAPSATISPFIASFLAFELGIRFIF